MRPAGVGPSAGPPSATARVGRPCGAARDVTAGGTRLGRCEGARDCGASMRRAAQPTGDAAGAAASASGAAAEREDSGRDLGAETDTVPEESPAPPVDVAVSPLGTAATDDAAATKVPSALRVADMRRGWSRVEAAGSARAGDSIEGWDATGRGKSEPAWAGRAAPRFAAYRAAEARGPATRAVEAIGSTRVALTDGVGAERVRAVRAPASAVASLTRSGSGCATGASVRASVVAGT